MDSVYDKNDTIAAFLDSGTSLGFVASGSGLFQLPMTGDSGTCNDNNYVTFENSVDESICNRILEANEGKFVSQCTNSLSVSRYAENLWLAK